MDKVLILSKLDILVEMIEELKKKVDSRVVVTFMSSKDDQPKKKTVRGKLTLISQLKPWNEFPPYFLNVEIKERNTRCIDFFSKEYILLVKDAVTKKVLYRIPKNKKLPAK